MQYSTKKLAEHKLIILHLLQKMGISLSNSEICRAGKRRLAGKNARAE